jgi:hypothetical protein
MKYEILSEEELDDLKERLLDYDSRYPDFQGGAELLDKIKKLNEYVKKIRKARKPTCSKCGKVTYARIYSVDENGNRKRKCKACSAFADE